MEYGDNTALGNNIAYPQTYDPTLLVPVSRQINRQKLGLNNELPFHGVDIWNAWELSWLNQKGKPQVATGLIEIPCDSENIIESKSLKLYLNSLNHFSCSGPAELASLISKDLAAVAGGAIKFTITPVDCWHPQTSQWTDAVCLDDLDISCTTYSPDPSLLRLIQNRSPVTEKICSHLLKTNCPVTGQPDWATLYIQYTGPRINHEGLLGYIVSMRQHQDFHEHCTESVFMDIVERCQPEKLTVYARYTRRGGIDINPFRSNFDLQYENVKLPRQ